MNFIPDPSEQEQRIIFSCNIKVNAHPQHVFNNNPVHEISSYKHLEMFLDFKLNLKEHFENML